MRIIKKYSNRRLYDTKASRSITLSEVARLIASGEEVRVVDFKTGADLTAVTLAQVILAHERGRVELPPIPVVLRELIRKGSSSILRLVERPLAASLGMIFLTEERVEKLVAELIESHQITPGQAPRLLKRLLGRVAENRELLQSQIKKILKEIIPTLNIPTQEEIAELREKLKRLSEELARAKSEGVE